MDTNPLGIVILVSVLAYRFTLIRKDKEWDTQSALYLGCHAA